MEVAGYELTLGELEAAFRSRDQKPLARSEGAAVYFTDVPQLGYTSALLVSPVDHAWLWAPDGVYNFNVPVSRPSDRRVRWLRSIADSRTSKKRFLQAMKQGGSSMSELPYGSVAYLGPDMGMDELWSQRRPPLWPGWYRAYAIPLAAHARAAFVARLSNWFASAGSFGTRAVPDSAVASVLRGEPESSTSRDHMLFTAEPQSENARAYREEYDQILSVLKRQIDRVENGHPLGLHELGPAFQAEDCSLRLIDYGVKDERRRLSEAVGKYRAHLLRVLRWPIFVEVAAAEIVGNERVGRVLPGYGSEAVPYDGWEDLKAYLDDMRSAHPAFFTDVLEDLYPVNIGG